MADTTDSETQSVARNRAARHEYQILDTWEAGIVLTGTEVKSLREGKVNIGDAYGIVRDGEVYLLNMNVSPYERGGYVNHEPTRSRKLLLHKREILKIGGKASEKGYTIIPLRAYFKDGRVKVEIGLARGKKAHDKRETIKRKDIERETRQAVRERR